MGNIENARRLIEALRAAGTEEFSVCAGSRNSPLLAVLGASEGVRLYSFVDERSAAFFALGRIKLHGRPVAVVTTSGTAVAELLPAAIEAHYAGLPLVLVSADRPARFRGTGAPQSIEQVGIFGKYAETSLEGWSGTQALHLNIEFDEPLIDGDPHASAASARRRADELPAPSMRRVSAARLPEAARPLVLIGGLAPEHAERVRRFVLQLGAPVYAEPLSGLREDRELPLVTAGERMLQRARFDCVIRIGNVPTLRYWRDLETSTVPVIHFSALPFTGVTRGALHPIEALPEVSAVAVEETFFADDRRFAGAFSDLLDQEPESELAMIRALSRSIAPGARIYLGNSLPIREWDLAAVRERRDFTIEANRGANGIDGQISTFYGQCDPSRENVCIVGDLTAIYDLNAPWIVPQLDPGTRTRIVVVNNGGGRIFSRVASLRAVSRDVRERIIENVHDLHFDRWAAMWGIDVTELRPDAAASERVWRRYDELWS